MSDAEYLADLVDELRAMAGWETPDMEHPGPFVLPFGTSLVIEAAIEVIEGTLEAQRSASIVCGPHHPWRVVDTWGSDGSKPVGCHTEQGALTLANRLSAGWGPGRYRAEPNEDGEF